VLYAASCGGNAPRGIDMTEWEILKKLYPDRDHSKKAAEAKKEAKKEAEKK